MGDYNILGLQPTSCILFVIRFAKTLHLRSVKQWKLHFQIYLHMFAKKNEWLIKELIDSQMSETTGEILYFLSNIAFTEKWELRIQQKSYFITTSETITLGVFTMSSNQPSDSMAVLSVELSAPSHSEQVD